MSVSDPRTVELRAIMQETGITCAKVAALTRRRTQTARRWTAELTVIPEERLERVRTWAKRWRHKRARAVC